MLTLLLSHLCCVLDVGYDEQCILLTVEMESHVVVMRKDIVG